VTTRFEADTAVTPDAEGGFAARIDPGWWVVAGPNGGYLAAILLRALERTVDDPQRGARSLTVHYTQAPAAGPARVETALERSGGALTTASARMLQDGRLVALALAAFSKPRRGGIALDHTRMPEVPPPERCPPLERRIPIHERYEQRWALGSPPFSGGREARGGGWIRTAEPQRVDAPLLAAYADAFPPALFSALAAGTSQGVPTVDLTVHFRATLPLPGARSDAWTLGVFRSHLSREGFLEEDGELWSEGGVLLAQSRQLALAR
jgi:acyl-CoA thioesterase